MDEVHVNRLGGLSLPRKSVVRLTDRPDMTLDVYRGRKTITQRQLTGYINCTSHVKLPLPPEFAGPDTLYKHFQTNTVCQMTHCVLSDISFLIK